MFCPPGEERLNYMQRQRKDYAFAREAYKPQGWSNIFVYVSFFKDISLNFQTQIQILCCVASRSIYWRLLMSTLFGVQQIHPILNVPYNWVSM